MHLEFPSPYHILYASYFVSKEWHHIKYIYSAAGAATPAPVCVCATMSHRYKPSSSPFVSRVFSCHVAICTWHRNLLCMFTNPSSLIQAPFYNLHFFWWIFSAPLFLIQPKSYAWNEKWKFRLQRVDTIRGENEKESLDQHISPLNWCNKKNETKIRFS